MLRKESEVVGSGRSLMDGLHNLSADDRLDFWEASAWWRDVRDQVRDNNSPANIRLH